MLSKLKIYVGSEHEHQAQQPDQRQHADPPERHALLQEPAYATIAVPLDLTRL